MANCLLVLLFRGLRSESEHFGHPSLKVFGRGRDHSIRYPGAYVACSRAFCGINWNLDRAPCKAANSRKPLNLATHDGGWV
ncbi:uncharacterized protein GGS22DRAFT_165812 [Annulohypoxylon maeteangense]|uniref:uncharacterized protein n=1 Tax=Annulohypoxylon maeteangense TaxID=1927788 RepID=UPI002007F1F8|nr:uncharacterized protein GGS22DRAFT_165812 [Annulohypoxylon maeteangense]KAI0883684.1 hypothetical protein GGS22DRAFT_165812 [Annulohypoxylon maeteangense]